MHGARRRAARGALDAGAFTGHLRDWPEADGLATRTPERAAAVLGADCLPVLMWRRDGPAVAAAHAGWRGLVAGVLEATVAGPGDPAAPGVAIGPGIGPCCYPVSAEVRDRFAAAFGEAVIAAAAVDLAAAARRALVAAGVPDAAIVTVAACTCCEAERFFSYRRDGAAPAARPGSCGRRRDVIDPDALREALDEARERLDEAAARRAGRPAGAGGAGDGGEVRPGGGDGGADRGRGGGDRREPAPGPPGQGRDGPGAASRSTSSATSSGARRATSSG